MVRRGKSADFARLAEKFACQNKHLFATAYFNSLTGVRPAPSRSKHQFSAERLSCGIRRLSLTSKSSRERRSGSRVSGKPK